MTNINNNYANSEALLKRLQMKNLMDREKEDVQEQQESTQEQGQAGATCSENNAGSRQALDYQALMNSTFIQNMKIQEGEFKTYTLYSTGTKIKINDETVTVRGSGTFEIAVEGNNVVIKAGKNASSITFNNTKDLNITVEKSEKYPTRSFNLTTGAGNDNIHIADGAKVSTIKSGKGDDVVIIGENAEATYVKTGDGDDTVINFGTVSNINTEKDNDVVLNKGTVTSNISLGVGDDIAQNDGIVKENIKGESGNDQIINNKEAKKLDGGNGTDTVIDENTLMFENSNSTFELKDGETAVVKEDGTIDVNINGKTITFNPSGDNSAAFISAAFTKAIIARRASLIPKQPVEPNTNEDNNQEETQLPSITPIGEIITPISPTGISDPRNEKVCQFLGWNTDISITNAQYDENGNLIKFNEPMIGNYEFKYNSAGQIVQMKFRSSISGKREQNIEYYPNGNIKKITENFTGNIGTTGTTTIFYKEDGTLNYKETKETDVLHKKPVTQYSSDNFSITEDNNTIGGISTIRLKSKYLPKVTVKDGSSAKITFYNGKTMTFNKGENVTVKNGFVTVTKIVNGKKVTTHYDFKGKVYNPNKTYTIDTKYLE